MPDTQVLRDTRLPDGADSVPPAPAESPVDERELVAMDLHDLAIQRLFAGALSLHVLRRDLAPGLQTDRLDGVVDDIRDTIGELRRAIGVLRYSTERAESLDEQVREVIASSARMLGYEPVLDLGSVRNPGIPAAMHHDIVAVLSEGLSNVARHSNASTVHVQVAVTTGNLRVRVSDNGDGIVLLGRRHGGLTNLAARAHRLGGNFTLASTNQSGTTMTWVVPLPCI